MNAKRIALVYSVLLVSFAILGNRAAAEDPDRPPRDVATEVIRAHLSTGGSEPLARRQLKQELQETHQLLTMALRDVRAGTGESNLTLVRAQIVRLLPLVDAAAASAASESGPTSEFAAIARALRTLADELGPPSQAGRANAAPSPRLLRQLESRAERRSLDPGPTVTQPTRKTVTFED